MCFSRASDYFDGRVFCKNRFALKLYNSSSKKGHLHGIGVNYSGTQIKNGIFKEGNLIAGIYNKKNSKQKSNVNF